MINIKSIPHNWEDGRAKTITFIVTKDCQLACKYCYLVGKNSKERMTFATAKAAIDFVLLRENDEDFAYKSVIWDFIGGEPFLEIELIDKICDYIKLEMYRLNHHWLNSYIFSFTTNGLNYSSVAVQKFIKKNINHLSIGLTIDGTQEQHDANRVFKNTNRGSYQEVVKSIPLWLQQFPDAQTKVTITHSNIPFIYESILHLFSLGIHNVPANVVNENVWEEGDDKIFEQQLMRLADTIIDNDYYKEYSCSLFVDTIGKPMDREKDRQNWCGCGEMLAVDAAGNFYPCTRFAQYSLRDKEAWIIGNVHSGIDKNKLRPFLTLDRCTQSSPECIDCDVASGCAWCQGENFDAAQTHTVFQRATAICKMHKARVRANNYYWNKLYRKLELEGLREEYEANKHKMKPEIC